MHTAAFLVPLSYQMSLSGLFLLEGIRLCFSNECLFPFLPFLSLPIPLSLVVFSTFPKLALSARKLASNSHPFQIIIFFRPAIFIPFFLPSLPSVFFSASYQPFMAGGWSSNLSAQNSAHLVPDPKSIQVSKSLSIYLSKPWITSLLLCK